MQTLAALGRAQIWQQNVETTSANNTSCA